MAVLRKANELSRLRAMESGMLHYVSGRNFSLDGKPAPAPKAALDARQAAFDTLSAYAQALVTLASDEPNKALDTNTKDLAGKIVAIMPDSGQVTAPLAAAFNAMGQALLDFQRAKKIEEEAARNHPSIMVIAEFIKKDLASAQDNMEGALLTITTTREKQLDALRCPADKARAQSAACRAPLDPKELMMSWRETMEMERQTTGPSQIPAVMSAVNAMVKAHAAIAAGNKASLSVAVKDLVRRARHAQQFYASLPR
jgi:hypothetical protein